MKKTIVIRYLITTIILGIISYILCFQKKTRNYIYTSNPIGYATLNGGTTGGVGGKTININNEEELRKEVGDNIPKIIIIHGTINLPHSIDNQNNEVKIGSNKTILGYGNNAKIFGNGFIIGEQRNIIIRNISFENAREDIGKIPRIKAGSDNITIISGSTNVWIDHCSFSDGQETDITGKYHDGAIDITEGSNYVTVSYCYFTNHSKVMLIGSDDSIKSDKGKLKVTVHHNFFDGTKQRHPRVRFGQVHVFNNCYKNINYYGIGIGLEAEIFSEKNNFTTNKKSQYKDYCSGNEKRNFIDIGSIPIISGSIGKVDWNPKNEYTYTTDPVENLLEICERYAGAGKMDR